MFAPPGLESRPDARQTAIPPPGLSLGSSVSLLLSLTFAKSFGFFFLFLFFFTL